MPYLCHHYPFHSHISPRVKHRLQFIVQLVHSDVEFIAGLSKKFYYFARHFIQLYLISNKFSFVPCDEVKVFSRLVSTEKIDSFILHLFEDKLHLLDKLKLVFFLFNQASLIGHFDFTDVIDTLSLELSRYLEFEIDSFFGLDIIRPIFTAV